MLAENFQKSEKIILFREKAEISSIMEKRGLFFWKNNSERKINGRNTAKNGTKNDLGEGSAL